MLLREPEHDRRSSHGIFRYARRVPHARPAAADRIELDIDAGGAHPHPADTGERSAPGAACERADTSSDA